MYFVLIILFFNFFFVLLQMTNFEFRGPFMENIVAWIPVFQPYLNRVLTEISFPEGCYSC